MPTHVPQVYQAALEKDTSYAATLSRSLSLVLDEFYRSMRSVGVSAVTGEGMTEFFQVSHTSLSMYEYVTGRDTLYLLPAIWLPSRPPAGSVCHVLFLVQAAAPSHASNEINCYHRV
jgi:hypothetical protein